MNPLEPVRKSIVVKASQEKAFRVFTTGIDSWWPRTHHIGKSPMKRVLIAEHTGGRCYTEQEDGSECDWGTVLAWEPPVRLAFAWQVTAKWEYEPELSRCTEVEVRFTVLGERLTRVDLEHRGFERLGEAAPFVRAGFDSLNAWQGMLEGYRVQTEE